MSIVQPACVSVQKGIFRALRVISTDVKALGLALVYMQHSATLPPPSGPSADRTSAILLLLSACADTECNGRRQLRDDVEAVHGDLSAASRQTLACMVSSSCTSQ
jgi:hypothetical protein